MHLKKDLSKLVNFCVAILILKMGGKINIFGVLCFIISRKVKMQLKCTKRSVHCIERVLWWIECVKSGLQSFVLEISCWTMLHGQVDRVEVDSDQIETIIENNQHRTTWEIANILRISKSSIENHLHQLGYVNRFDVWVPYKLSGKNLLDCIPIFLNVLGLLL